MKKPKRNCSICLPKCSLPALVNKIVSEILSVALFLTYSLPEFGTLTLPILK